MWPKIDIFKSRYFVVSKPTGVEKIISVSLYHLQIPRWSICGLHQEFRQYSKWTPKGHCYLHIGHFHRLLRNVIGLMPVKFQSIIAKHVASIFLCIICWPTDGLPPSLPEKLTLTTVQVKKSILSAIYYCHPLVT